MPGGTCRRGSTARRLRPRRPADPLRQLLRLPRARRRGSARPTCGSTPDGGIFAERDGVRVVPRASPTRASWSAGSRATTRTRRCRRRSTSRPLTPAEIDAADALDRRGGEVAGSTGRSSRRGRPALPRGRATPPGRATRSTASSWPGSRREGLAPVAGGGPEDADPPGHARPDRPAADARGGRRLPRRHVARRLRDGSSTGCSPRPAYGERMALDWLDAARYADTNGYQSDSDRDMWPLARLGHRRLQPRTCRSTGSPIEQLAGDLLPERDASSRRSPPASTATT